SHAEGGHDVQPWRGGGAEGGEGGGRHGVPPDFGFDASSAMCVNPSCANRERHSMYGSEWSFWIKSHTRILFLSEVSRHHCRALASSRSCDASRAVSIFSRSLTAAPPLPARAAG